MPICPCLLHPAVMAASIVLGEAPKPWTREVKKAYNILRAASRRHYLDQQKESQLSLDDQLAKYKEEHGGA